MNTVKNDEVKLIIKELYNDYTDDNRGIQIEFLGNHFKLTTKQEHKEYYEKLLEYTKNVKLPKELSEEDMLDMAEQFAKNPNYAKDPRYIEYILKYITRVHGVSRDALKIKSNIVLYIHKNGTSGCIQMSHTLF